MDMLHQLTRADSTRQTMGAFLALYRKLRPVDFYLGVLPEAGEPGAYRIAYALGPRELDAVDGARVPSDMARPNAQGLEVLRGGLLASIIATTSPKFVGGLSPEVLRADVALRHVPQHCKNFVALPVLSGREVTQWTLSFSATDQDEVRDDDLVRACVIANLLGVANRGFDALAEVRRLSARLREQIDGVVRVQRALLPRELPAIRGHRVAASYLPSEDAGGDFYGYQLLEESSPEGPAWGVLIADVSGHGAAAATVTALLTGVLGAYVESAGLLEREVSRATLSPRAIELLSPASLAAFCNRQMTGVDIDNCFVTAFIFSLHADTGRVVYSNSGHNPPIVWRAATGRVERWCDACTCPLGIVDPHDASNAHDQLHPGDVLLLYTDGIVELFDPPRREQFGIERLEAALARAAAQGQQPEGIIDAVHAAMREFRQSDSRDDDQTMVVIARDHAPPAPERGA